MTALLWVRNVPMGTSRAVDVLHTQQIAKKIKVVGRKYLLTICACLVNFMCGI